MFSPINERVGKSFRFDPRGASTNGWQEYVVPRGATALYLIAVGSGGGGGGGFGAAAGTARGGGGGGSSGAISKLWIPTLYIPTNLLYIQPGAGGNGGASGAAGSAGGNTRVSLNRGTGSIDYLLAAGGGNQGTPGTAAAAGGAGSAPSAATFGTAMFQNWGLATWTVGGAGTAGGIHTGAAGAAITFSAQNVPLLGGTGGGGCTTTEFAGGNITGSSWLATLLGGVAGPNRGNNGVTDARYSLFGTGGTGGGSSNTTVGGAGGDGAPGCGGGGGGAGVTTGGAGGRGGDGFVIIMPIF